jgi:hypothetical protein
LPGLAIAATLATSQAFADAVTDWNLYTALTTKGATSKTTGSASAALNSNVATRVAAIEARAVFDAVNVIERFSNKSYYYSGSPSSSPTPQSASAAAAQAAHDVLHALQPNVNTRAWLDSQLASDLAALGVDPVTDPGVVAGQAAAATALAARTDDNSAIRTGYIPTSNISADGKPNATGNPGIGLWRPNNGEEYNAELYFVKTHGQDFANPGNRTDDQLLQALYYKADAELFTNEAARTGSAARGFSLVQNAKLFAALDSALADARIAAWQSKYDLAFWRPVTALNAEASGAASVYEWKPLGTTPSHPSNTSGHSATVSAGTEILRAFFKSDNIVPSQQPQTLTIFPWLVGTNNGTGKLATPIGSEDATTRNVSTLTQLQLENGRSRLYLGVHYGNDDFQGQTLGLSVADAILADQQDPAVQGVTRFTGHKNAASARNLYSIFVNNSDISGFYGLDDNEE